MAEAINKLAPSAIANQLGTSVASPYAVNLLKRAHEEYPFIQQHKPMVIVGNGEGYAETWPIDEPGAPEYARPTSLPIDRLGIEVRRPSQFTHHDLAAEVLHIDPFANTTREKMMSSWTPAQLETLKQQSGDYQFTLNEPGRTEEDAIRNATDSAIRGVVVNQWPKEANAAMQYTPSQQQLLQSLSGYMRGKK